MSYIADNLEPYNHCFFGRQGGVSTGKYESLNVNTKSDDKKENLQKNFEIITEHFALTPLDLCTPNQIHSNKAVFISEPSFKTIDADAVVTKTRGIILGISTADCAPILFHDPKNHIIAALHAGWRGALDGIIENTVYVLLQNGAQLDTISAAIGPCMLKKSFQCQQDMVDKFTANNPVFESYFSKQTDGSYLYDSEKFLIDKLNQTGITNISTSGIDTYSDPDNFFSYRRHCHLEQVPHFGTQLSTIVLRNS